MEISNTIGVLQRSDLSKTKSIVLVHLSDGNSNANRFVEDVKGQLASLPAGLRTEQYSPLTCAHYETNNGEECKNTEW